MLALCVGMYRACSTWQYGVVGSILERHDAGCRLGFLGGLTFVEKGGYRAAADPGWHAVKTHDAHPSFCAPIRDRQAVAIYAHRDLRDVVASYKHKTGIPFATLMERGFVELCLRNDAFWRSQPGVLVQRYDDLIADPVAGVEQIAEHLSIALRSGEAGAIADDLSWQANQRRTERLAQKLRQADPALTVDDQTKFDPVTLLHWNHIRSAHPDARPDTLAPDQRRLVERLGATWLASNGYPAPAATDVVAAAIVRTAHAPTLIDLRLDRWFRGTKGTIVDFDAIHPRLANPSYYFYERGWRTISIGTTPAPRDRFVPERPKDLNLASRFEPERAESAGEAARAGFAAGVLRDLIAEHRLADPELMILGARTDAGLILGAVADSPWRPPVVVVHDEPVAGASPQPWQATLGAMGYRAVPGLVGPRVFVRADQAEAVPVLARPIGSEDGYRRVEWSDEDRAVFADLQAQLARIGQPEPEPIPDVSGLLLDLFHTRNDLHDERDASHRAHQGWQGERVAWQGERDAQQRERDAQQRERDAWAREREEYGRERDARDRERAEGEAERADLAAQLAAGREAHRVEQADLVAQLDAARSEAAEVLGRLDRAQVESDRRREEARAARRRSRRARRHGAALEAQLAQLKTQLDEQVEARLCQLMQADRRLAATEQALAAAEQALAEVHRREAERQARAGLFRPALRRLGRLTGSRRHRVDGPLA